MVTAMCRVKLIDRNIKIAVYNFGTVCCFARLFAKLPQPGDSEMTFKMVFESNCLLPV